MAVDREGAMAALVARLQSKVGSSLAVPVKRRLLTYSALGTAEQPCMCVIAEDDSLASDGPEPSKPTMRVAVLIYARADADPTASAETALFAIVGAIDNALRASPADLPDGTILAPGQMVQAWTNLGGKVVWAKPGGIVKYDSGQTEDQGIAEYPIDLLLAPA